MTGRQNRLIAAILGCGALLSACATDSEQTGEKRWSTKQDSVIGTVSDRPTLNAGPSMPTGPVSDIAELREPALSVLMQAAESTNPMLRANAIEALQDAPERLPGIVRKGLADENRGVRFVAAVTVGKLKMTDLALLAEPLLHDESQSVQAAAIFALRRCGRKADLNPLSAMLSSDDPEVKANAAFVLGELGDPSAVRLLRFSVGRGLVKASPVRRKIVELQLAQAMVKLGETSELDVIHAALFATAEEGELIVLACQMCGELKDASRLPDLRNLLRWNRTTPRRPPEIRLAAAWAIGQIEPASTPLDVPVDYVGSDRWELRAQAAHVFAVAAKSPPAPGTPAGVGTAVGYLGKLLSDPNPAVQVTAAQGIVKATKGP